MDFHNVVVSLVYLFVAVRTELTHAKACHANKRNQSHVLSFDVKYMEADD